MADPFWSNAWKMVKCAGAIGTFIAGNVILISKIRKAGGLRKVAKLLRKKGSAEKKAKAFLAIVGEVGGINAVIKACKK